MPAVRHLLLAVFVTATTAAAASGPEESLSLFDHPESSRWWLSGQVNLVGQGHPTFPSGYTGSNSLRADAEGAVSFVGTVYGGFQVTPLTEMLVSFESVGGRGIGNAVGLAGFTNIDVVRNPTLSPLPYLGRALVRQIIPLSPEQVTVARSTFGLATTVPELRLEIRVGKFSTADVFDLNSVGSDSHFQFLNWTVVNNGAYDYATDIRGYSAGATVELDTVHYSVRFGEMLMPSVADGQSLELGIAHSRSENLELEWRGWALGGRPTTLRLLGYLNHAAMGSYPEALAAFRSGQDAVPDLNLHAHAGSLKEGIGLNFEHQLPYALRVFFRAGWNEGDHESFAYTEVNDSVSGGLDALGTPWGRSMDRSGLALVSNGISSPHRAYLALGGKDWLLGDGALRYGRESLFEYYYAAYLFRGIFATLDLQGILNPGYDHGRGPLLVGSVRLHIEL